MGFHYFSFIFLQILCYSLIETAPSLVSMSTEILKDSNALQADKVIQSIWQREPSNLCDIEKPKETQLTNKAFLNFNFGSYLCVILYDASIRYLNLNISQISYEIQNNVADVIIRDALPDTFCKKMKANKWYTSIDANKLWVSEFNSIMKNESLCQRYCVTDIVNPLCAYALWIDSAVKKVERSSFHSENTKDQVSSKARLLPILDSKQHPTISGEKQAQAVPSNDPNLAVKNGNQNLNMGGKKLDITTSFVKQNTNAANAIDNSHTFINPAVGKQTVNPLPPRGYTKYSNMAVPHSGEDQSAGQTEGNVLSENGHKKIQVSGISKDKSPNEGGVFDNKPNSGRTEVPPPNYIGSSNDLTQIQQQQRLQENTDKQRLPPQGKSLGDLDIPESFSNQGNTSPVGGIRPVQGVAVAKLPGQAREHSGTASSAIALADAGQTGRGSSQKTSNEQPLLNDIPKMVNKEQNIADPNVKAQATATSVQIDNASRRPTQHLERPDSSLKIASPAASLQPLVPESLKQSQPSGDKITDKETVNTTVPEARVKEEPGSNKEESAEPKVPTISKIEKSEPEDANQANEAEINAGAAPEPDDHEEQKAVEEGALGGREEDSDTLGGHGEAPPPETEDELLDSQDLPTEEPRFNEDDESPMKPDAASTKLTNNDFGAGSDEEDTFGWRPDESGRAVQNDADAGYAHDRFVDAEDSHFFAYFMTMIILCIIGYLIFHNKQKILALALEGRVRKGSRRRPSTSGYRKLDSNLEEAVTSSCTGSSVTHVIY